MMVEVKTPARLHLGLIELGGHFGRMYGGLGVAIEQPSCHVKVETDDGPIFLGQEVEYVENIVNIIKEKLGLTVREKITVLETIPRHKGLGSRTQLSLAVAMGLVKIHGLDIPVEELSRILGRGNISFIGTAVFKHGGFIVDFPRQIKENNKRCFLRFDFPEEWTFVVVYPQEESGPPDDVEKEMLTSTAPMDEVKCSKISHHILVRLLPALLDRDVHGFGEALTEVQRLVGQHFSNLQGGIYKNSKGVILLERSGALGIGQSSWGPAVYGLFPSVEMARKAALSLDEKLDSDWNVFVAKPINYGARILITP